LTKRNLYFFVVAR